MKALERFTAKNKEAMGSKTMKVGSYSFAVTVILLAIIVAVNIAVSALPSTWTHYDISAAQLYSVTSATKSVVQNLNKDVTIYWITQSGQEDAVIEKLLDVYDAQSSHLTVEKKNPDVFPTFAAKYTDGTVTNNSLVVECGDRYRYIPYNSIYTADMTSYYLTGSAAYEFDGEGLITTAINYVVTENLPKIYILDGHGEEELTESFEIAIQRQNYETEKFSLLNVDAIPDDADAVLINSPSNDLSKKEVDMLKKYLSEGGKLVVISGPKEEETFDNLHTIVEDYGISFSDGIVLEGNTQYYAFGYPNLLLPELQDSEITGEMKANNNYIVLNVVQGMKKTGSKTGAVVTPLLMTSDEAFSKVAGYEMDTWEREADDISGPFAIAYSVSDSTNGAEIVWISTDYLTDDVCNSYSAGANEDFFMNCVSWAAGETESITIRSKSLDYKYLTINTKQGNFIKLCLIGIIPVLYLAYGIDEVIRRKKRT